MSDVEAVLVAGVAKRYRGRRGVQALDGVALQVAQGEIYGLLGRNGAGKTTLVKILLDLVRPSAGSTALLGISSRQVRARVPVGYLPEDHRLPEYRSAEATMDFYARLSGIDRGERRRRIPALLDLVGLSEAARRKVRSFSKGMKQRLGLAQALVHDPLLVFLDEPTDGVDPVGRAEIRDVLVRLREEGRTVFLNSHLLSEVEQICDRVGILERGRLVEEGSIENLTSAQGVVELELASEPGVELLAQLSAFAQVRGCEGGTLELKLDEEEQIDQVIDLLRAGGVGIRALAAKKSTLEEVFLDLLDHDEGGAA